MPASTAWLIFNVSQMEEQDTALKEAHTNPQASACLGITLFSGLAGTFFIFLATDLITRIAAGGICLVIFAAGIFGHRYFKKSEMHEGFNANHRVRHLIGVFFFIIILAAIALSLLLLILFADPSALLLAISALCLVPFARGLLKKKKG